MERPYAEYEVAVWEGYRTLPQANEPVPDTNLYPTAHYERVRVSDDLSFYVIECPPQDRRYTPLERLHRLLAEGYRNVPKL